MEIDKIWINQAYKKYKPQILEVPSLFESEPNSSALFPMESKFSSTKGNCGEIDIVIKAYNFTRLPLEVIKKRKLIPENARKSKNIAMTLLKAGIATPEPIAFLEFQNSQCQYQSYLICRAWEENFNVYLFMDYGDKPRIDHRSYLKQLAKFVTQVHNLGIFHSYMMPENILLRKNGDEFEFALDVFNHCQKKYQIGHNNRLRSLATLTPIWEITEIVGREYAVLNGYDPKAFIDDLYYKHWSNWIDLHIRRGWDKKNSKTFNLNFWKL